MQLRMRVDEGEVKLTILRARSGAVGETAMVGAAEVRGHILRKEGSCQRLRVTPVGKWDTYLSTAQWRVVI